MFFSESLIDFGQALRIWREIAFYVEAPCTDQAIIFDFMWSEQHFTGAWLEIQAGQSRLLPIDPTNPRLAEFIALAESTMIGYLETPCS